MSSEVKREIIASILANLRAIDGDMDRLDEAAAARLRISRTDFRCLDILSRGSAITPGRLAKEMGLTTGAITALLDRLEKAGYVMRRRDLKDRRRILVEPSKRATDEVWPIFRGVVTAATRTLNQFDSGELKTVLRFLEENRVAIHRQLRT
ncbi:MAG TPA: MarR family transcriptional regulator [Candidatus Acidoferrales bacterium]